MELSTAEPGGPRWGTLFRGLVILFGPASAGKTTALLKLEAAGLPVFLHEEPREPVNDHWESVPVITTERELPDGSTVVVPVEDGPADFAALPYLAAVDSLRSLLFSAPGAALKGGISAGALLPLTKLHNELWEAHRGLLATINPVYDDEEASRTNEHTRLAQGLISGSVGGLIVRAPATTRRGAIAVDPFSWELGFNDPKPAAQARPWMAFRDRANQLDPLIAVLNRSD